MPKILAIDDNSDNLISLKAIIRDTLPDAEVLTSLNGQKGIDLAMANNPDVILLDIIMPDVDGFEVCRLLKLNELVKHIPVVFLTALKDDKVNRIKALEVGAEGFLSKPIDEIELMAQIRSMVKIKAANEKERHEKERLEKLVAERTRQLEAELQERQRTEKALKESEERFQMLFNQAPLGYQSLDFNGCFIEVNQKWLDSLGFTRDEVIGKWFGDFLSPEFRDGFRQRFPLFKSLGQIHSEFEMVHKNGTKLFIAFEGKIGYNNDGGFKQTHCILQDITEQKKSEAELIEKNKFIQTILDNLPIGIALNKIDEGSATYMNKKFEEIYGWSSSEITSIASFFEHVYPDREYRIKLLSQIMQDIQSGDPARMHWENISATRKDGSVRIVNAVNIPLVEQNTMVSTVSDITDLHKTQNDLRTAKEKAEESDRLKSAFLANMSHEIRTPLNSIIGFSELLTDPDFTAEQQIEFARLINSSGNNLLSIISDIMDLSKIEVGQIQVEKSRFCVDQLLSDIQHEHSLKAREKGIELRIYQVSPPTKTYLYSDQFRIKQILANFVTNAIKFTDQGFIEIGFEKEEDFLRFKVCDTGIGIPKEFCESVFERFIQVDSSSSRKYGGNGLGLAISKSLVEILGGRIGVESVLGKGSVFYFSIPYEAIQLTI